MNNLGQQVVAEEAMDIAAKEGHWVVLQNIHLGLIGFLFVASLNCLFIASRQMVTTIGEEIRTMLGNWP